MFFEFIFIYYVIKDAYDRSYGLNKKQKKVKKNKEMILHNEKEPHSSDDSVEQDSAG